MDHFFLPKNLNKIQENNFIKINNKNIYLDRRGEKMKIEISVEELEKLLKKAPVEKTDADEKILQAVNQFL